MEVAFISAATAIIVAALSLVLSKRKEREAEWRGRKLHYYEELVSAHSGIVGSETPASAKSRFANAINNIHLIASQNVIDALHRFCGELSESNPDRTFDRQNHLWSKLIWHIRKDLGDAPSRPIGEFLAIIWDSGTGSNAQD